MILWFFLAGGEAVPEAFGSGLRLKVSVGLGLRARFRVRRSMVSCVCWRDLRALEVFLGFQVHSLGVACRNVTANEPQFTGHFPDRPIMPGVLMVEAPLRRGPVGSLRQA